ncbi:PREDICTED: F-box/kelch-repeat protein At3g24760-like [Tarenaya hassleriana]|uniref:F-box/kelch-repeat protein At3g24760-like n=1 Tax=Tarenaya hassleriana TaxID=28532 RepID=UPI00053C9091|nr:PREDICTED: F-box/kelch-repeat protein At3g24760-like [Tarenaya hassleriana]
MSDHNPQSSSFNALSIDLAESIFSLLPIPSLVRSSAVCKLWRSIITSLRLPSPSPSPSPWLFLFGIHNTSSFHNQSFAFDPLSDTWLRLPSATASSFPSLYLVGSDGFLFSTAPRFSFSPILKPRWRFTSPVRFHRISPLLGVFSGENGSMKFILVGGVGFIGGLVEDIEDREVVEVYDPVLDSWEMCPPLPADFRSGYAYQTLSAALFKRRFYVFGIYSCFVTSFCLDSYTWSDVQTLRPPGLLFASLNSCSNMLVLGGMCLSTRGYSFNLWKIDENSMEFSEIAIMPEGVLSGLVDNEDEDSTRFASLKCVGLGNLIYVFNEDNHKNYPACVCEINGEKGSCRWRKMPQLPSPVNKFHKVVSFCSNVSASDVFQFQPEGTGTQIGSRQA